MLSPHCSTAASVSNTFTQLCLLLTLWVTRTYHVTVTQTRVWGKDLFSKTPLSAGNRALLCRCFHTSALCWYDFSTAPHLLIWYFSSTMRSFVGKPIWQTCVDTHINAIWPRSARGAGWAWRARRSRWTPLKHRQRGKKVKQQHLLIHSVQ